MTTPLSVTKLSTSLRPLGFSDPSKMLLPLPSSTGKVIRTSRSISRADKQRRIERAAALDEQVAAVALLELGDRVRRVAPSILWLFSQASGSSEWVSTYLLMRWNLAPIGLSWLYGQ